MRLFGAGPLLETEGLAGGENALPLETKGLAEDGGRESLEPLLVDLAREMRDQFQLFRRLRQSAGAFLNGADDEDVQEAAARQARADAKAATDAISLIVRTLEKLDQLLRQMARDRADALTDGPKEEDREALRAAVETLIEARARDLSAVRRRGRTGRRTNR